MKAELPKEYYDNGYLTADKYKVHYKDSPYFKIWKSIMEILNRKERIVDLGCGPGQFAEMLIANKKNFAYGVDFSPVAIKMAKENNPHQHFFEYSVYEDWVNEDWDIDTVICLEVLEHLTNDLEALEMIPSGTRVIFSVPDFDTVSHVRHFQNIEEVYWRYAKVLTLKEGWTNVVGGKRIFVVDAVKP